MLPLTAQCSDVVHFQHLQYEPYMMHYFRNKLGEEYDPALNRIFTEIVCSLNANVKT